MLARKEVQSWKQKRNPAELGLCVEHLFPSHKQELFYFDRLFLLLTAVLAFVCILHNFSL